MCVCVCLGRREGFLVSAKKGKKLKKEVQYYYGALVSYLSLSVFALERFFSIVVVPPCPLSLE